MTRRIFHCLCTVAAVSALLLPSCAKVEMIDGGAPIDPDQIAFGVTTGVTPMPEMRGGSQEEETPAMLLSPGGEDTLYLHPSVIANDRGFSSPDTRGVPIEVRDSITSFFVTAKVNDDGNPAADALYFDETKVKHAGNGVWTTTDGKHFWPDGQTTLDFYAYSNLTFSDGSEGSTAPAGNLKMEDGTLSFSYTVPGGTTAGTGTPASTDAAKQQPDILFALASANRTQTQEGGSGTVELNFQHALAGVQFRAKNIAGGTIRSITLKNLYGQGDCTYTLSDETTDSGARQNVTFEWSNLGGESKTRMDFVQKMEVVVKESSTQLDGTRQDVTTGANNEMTFMMIPQSTEGVEVEIELLGALDGKTYTVSGKLSGPDASSPIEWEAGKIYIYDISTDSINWTYVFEVTPTINMVLGQTSAQYTVNSYRYRTQNQAETEPVPWTATNTSFSETNFMTGSDEENVAYDKIVRSFVYSGGASTDANTNTYQIEVHGTKMHTSYD
ncbi:MAG TPA: fimbrillin family protein, partial [Candidatus Cryptobacteroides pullicola]|nr:fimbrillin family protein [Candidatus Cryptobacteroides pullicola]